MNDKEADLTNELLCAQLKLAEMYRKNMALDRQRHELTLRLNELSNGQGYSISGKSALVNDHAIDLHLQETLRLRHKNPVWRMRAWWFSLKIRRLGLFDFRWYLERYPDIKQTGMRPFKHFLMHGIFEGRDPSPRFNTRIYLGECLHMLDAGEPAIFHYLTWGRAAGIPASPNAVYPGTRLIAAKLAAIEDDLVAIQEKAIEHSTYLERSEETLKRLTALATFTGKSIKKLATQIASSTNSIKESSSNDADQLGRLIGIQNYLIHGQHPLSFRGSSVSPDLGLILIDLLSRNKYDLIIEFGSGTSTVLISKIVDHLHKVQGAESDRTSPHIDVFEHLPNYHEKIISILEQEGLQHIAQVHLTPLKAHTEGDGTTVPYYDCHELLSELASKSTPKMGNSILVLVDGPPEGTNLMARLPALDVLKDHFPMACIELVLNGYRRPNELAIVETWARECSRAGIPFSFEAVQTEKGCAIFRYRG